MNADFQGFETLIIMLSGTTHTSYPYLLIFGHIYAIIKVQLMISTHISGYVGVLNFCVFENFFSVDALQDFPNLNVIPS